MQMKQQSTVLIVDDQEPARQNLEMLLRKEGYHLAFASDGVEALAQAKKLVPDLILLDIMMPDMDGFEVCRRLRAHPLLAEVPVLMVTALSNRDHRLQSIEAGADDFISKPFDGVELRTRVRSITRLNRYRQLLVERVRFRWVVEQAEEGYVIVNENDQVLYANPRARLYLDLPENGGEPINVPFMEWVCQQYNCEPREAWQNWPQQPDGQAVRYLVRPETLTARAFWMRVDVLNLPSGSDVVRTIRLRDVTSQMNTLRDMYGFNTMVTHKLLTPMVHLMGSLDLLARYYRDQMMNPDVAELFETAHEGASRLDRDINDIVQYLRALPGLAQAKDAFSLAQLKSVIAMVSAELELDTVNVSYPDSGFSDDTRIVLSARAVELILWELLENAKKFHPQQSPTVEISASRSNAREVYLQISDDGLTLSPEHLAQVWTPYYQAEKIFTGEVLGMGLGLTMVSTLVWGVGGTCHIRNRVPGPGVVVELTLPLVQEARSKPQQYEGV
jgi:two-component system cell cycle response regulator